MRRTLGTLALLLVLAGCGDDEPGGTAPECDSDHSDCSTPPVLVSGTAGDGEVSTEATELADDADVASYVDQFSDPFAAEVTEAVEAVSVPPGNTLVAAVVSVGCDVPPGVDVERAGDGIEITPERVAKPLKECFAPVTTVALAAVPA